MTATGLANSLAKGPLRTREDVYLSTGTIPSVLPEAAWELLERMEGADDPR